MKLLILATFVATACAMDYVGPSWPRLPLDLLLKGERPVYGSNNDVKIVGGTEVRPPNSVPSQISLQRFTATSWGHSCGGSILSPSTILSSSHCVSGANPWSLRVVAGEHSFKMVTGKEQLRNVTKVIRHKDFGQNSYENDISLIFLDSPLDMSAPEVAAITLPSSNSEVPEGSKLYVTGWGNTGVYPEPEVLSDVLMGLEIPFVNDVNCNRSWPGQIQDSKLCAGGFGADACYGDYGGPLFISKGSNVQVGIASWVAPFMDCATPGLPGIYTEVSKFITWIQENNKP